jgi:adenylate cyclase
MALEIERKFLVLNEDWRDGANAGTDYCQGYLGEMSKVSIRVRIEGQSAKLNIKQAVIGISRLEFEYPIPVADARQLLDLAAGPLVEKRRYHVPVGSHVFEVDVYAGENTGLTIAEVELAHPDEPFARPVWLGAEVSHDPRYYNTSLARCPYRSWHSHAGP